MKRIPEYVGRVALACLLLAGSLAAPVGHAQEVVDAAGLRAAVAAEQARPPAPPFPRIAFLAQPDRQGAWLSPDGTRVAYLRQQGNARGVWIVPTAGGKPVRVLAQTDADTLAWSRDARWLFLASKRQLFALAASGQGGSRAISRLGGKWARSFAFADPSQPAAAVVFEAPPHVSRTPKRWRVFRVDAAGRETLLHEDARTLVDVALDGRGRVAFLIRVEGEAHVVLRMQGGRLVPAMRCERLVRCSLVSASADGREAIVTTDAGGDKYRLARLTADNTLQTLHADPHDREDLFEVSIDPVTQAPLFARYASAAQQTHGLTPEARTHLAAIAKQLPGPRGLRVEVGRGPGARWLVHDRAATRKGERLHVYDPATGALREMLADTGYLHRDKPAPALAEAAMARKFPFVYRASDGLPVHGFVLVPPGVDVSRAPLIAHVHGGPFALFRPEFSSLGQLLANRGYVVFESNFRGSTGFGQAYMRAGKGDYGNGRVQRDIVEGVQALLAQGIGDRARVGIVGGSFGGYSALQGVTFQPDLFKVGVAAVPPADLGWVVRWYSRSVDQMTPGIPLSTSMRLLELDPADPVAMERLRAQSPIANAGKLARPVLLIAGADDERVPIRSVMHYAAALSAKGKDVSLLVDPEGRHQVSDPDTREAYMFLAERLLQRRLGGRAPEPPDRRLKAFIDRNLLLRGSDFPDRRD